MSSKEQEVGLSAAFVQEHADAIASACAGSLTNVLGTDFSATMKKVDATDASKAIEVAGPVLHALCRGGSDGAGFPLHVVAARDEAAVLSGLQLGEDAEEIEEATKSELSGERRAAFQGVAKALLGSVVAELGDALAGEVAVQDAREIADPVDDPTWLDPGNFVRLRLSIECELIEDGILFLLLPGDGSEAPTGGSNLIFLERCPDEYERLESLGGSLACQLSVEQPDLFLAELEGDVGGATIIVPWDLGGRSGLEMVEALRADARFAGARIAMSSDAPTRGQVGSAMRAGSMTFLSRPYLKEEIERRLLGRTSDASGSASAEAADAPQSADGLSDESEKAGETE